MHSEQYSGQCAECQWTVCVYMCAVHPSISDFVEEKERKQKSSH